jgi:hypothetical protein
VVISDWHRDHEKDSEGHPLSGIDTYKLIRALPEYRQTAFVFYTADGLDAVQAQVKDDPNAASTNVPDVLLQRILKAIPPSP